MYPRSLLVSYMSALNAPACILSILCTTPACILNFSLPSAGGPAPWSISSQVHRCCQVSQCLQGGVQRLSYHRLRSKLEAQKRVELIQVDVQGKAHACLRLLEVKGERSQRNTVPNAVLFCIRIMILL